MQNVNKTKQKNNEEKYTNNSCSNGKYLQSCNKNDLNETKEMKGSTKN